MRFAHTADWQIGMKASGLGHASAAVQDARLESGRRLVASANRLGCEYLLVAGDLFEHNAVSRTKVRQVAEILAAFAGPVCIIPGNHDPFIPGSVWDHPVWKERTNLRVITKRESIDIGAAVLFPTPLFEKNSMADPTTWIKPDDDGRIHIGLGHGTVVGVPQEEPDYPIPRDAAALHSLDYLAIGHWHSTALFPSADGSIRMAYCGTHETSKFGERDSGNFLVVDIAGPGAIPAIRTESVGTLRWEVIEHPLLVQGDFAPLHVRLDAIANPGTTLLDVRVSGLLYAADQPMLVRLRELAQGGRFLACRIDESGLRPAPDDENWLSGLPPGVVREVAQHLRDLSRRDYVGDRPAGEDADTAARALIELYGFLQEPTK